MNRERPYPPNPYDFLPAAPAFTLTSESFSDGTRLPKEHAKDQENVSPQLSWSDVPEGTKSFAVTCFDPDAPTPSGYWHWTVLNVPASVTELATGAGTSDETLPEGAFHVKNSNEILAYSGPLPPEGDHEHRYIFVVHALDVDRLDLDPAQINATIASFNIGMHTLGRAMLIGTYQR